MALQIPDKLAKNLPKGKVVLFVGSGMSQPQFPGWRGLLERMMQQAIRECVPVDLHRKNEIDQLIARNELLVAAGQIKQALGNEFWSILNSALPSPRQPSTAAHKLLPKVSLRAILTTNYDKLIEKVYIHPKVPSMSKSFFIWKLHGDVDDEDSIIFDKKDYATLKFNTSIQTVLEGLFQHNTVLFVGYGLKDPDLLLMLERLATILPQTGPHFALMQIKDMPDWELREFRDQYRILIFGDHMRDDNPDIEKLLRQILNSSRHLTNQPRHVASDRAEELISMVSMAPLERKQSFHPVSPNRRWLKKLSIAISVACLAILGGFWALHIKHMKAPLAESILKRNIPTAPSENRDMAVPVEDVDGHNPADNVTNAYPSSFRIE